MCCLTNFVFSLLRINKRHTAMALPEANLNVNTHVIGSPDFRV
jgi:hypothetical protein